MLSNLNPAYTNFFENYIEENYSSYGDDLADMYYHGAVEYRWTMGEWWISEHIMNLIKMIINKFYNWEVHTMNVANFEITMRRTFEKYRDYYEEMFTAYETYINMLESNKVTRTYEDDTEATPRTKYESKTFDIPRSESQIDRPTTKTQNGGIEGSDTNHGEGTSTIVGGDLLEMKKKYLSIIRSLYDEFAEKFKINFIEMFDYTEVAQ